MKIFFAIMSTIITTGAVMSQAPGTGNFASVNGLKMYYEIHGQGKPLVLIHGGGSTITSSFGYWLPLLARTHRVIAVEMQAHGRTADIDRSLSFEQDADDIAVLLKQLNIEKTDLLGFSNGATTSIQVAIRHPGLVNKLVLASGNYKRDGMPPGFFDGMKDATIEVMPKELSALFLKVNPDPRALQAMFDRDKARMIAFKDIPDAAIRSVKAPALIINGDADVVSNEHAVMMKHLLKNATLAIVPGGHGEYLGDVNSSTQKSRIPDATLTMIEEFLIRD